MTRHLSRTAVVLTLVVALVAGAAVPATAQSSDSNVVSDFLDTDVSVKSVAQTLSDWSNFVSGYTSRLGSEPDRTAAECASDIQAEINNNSAAWQQRLNQNLSASTSRNVLEVRCQIATREGLEKVTKTESVYLVADVQNGSYTGLQAVDNTSRTVDHVLLLQGSAAKTAPDDLAEFRKKFIAENRSVPRSYAQKMKGQYAGSVYGTFEPLPPLPDDAENETA